MDTCTATWDGPFTGQLVTSGRIVTLAPGDEAEVTEADLASGHWTGVDNTPPVSAPTPSLGTPAPLPTPPTEGTV